MYYSSGVTRSVNTPVKDSANHPFVTSSNLVPANDQSLSFVSVTKHVDDNWYMHYYGARLGVATPYANYATSTDGLTWTKPNLGVVTYDGDTDNNIIQIGVFTSCRYEPTISKWVMTMEKDAAEDNGVFIYTADDPQGPYTLQKHLFTGTYNEGKDVIRRPDGRWVAYFSSNQASNLRRISAWLSDTTDMTGTWTKYDYVIPVTSNANQPYGVGVSYIGGAYVAILMVYDSTAGDGTIRIDLWRSRTGVNDWDFMYQDFIPLGTSGAFDDYMVINGSRFTADGDLWHIYYCGAPNGHQSASTGWNREIGRATLGRGRLVGVSGAGTLIMSAYNVIEDAYTAASMTINADASAGSLSMELRDANGDPIPGYTFDDFDTVTTDVYDHVPTWGGQPIPAESVIGPVFAMSNATLYGYTITRS